MNPKIRQDVSVEIFTYKQLDIDVFLNVPGFRTNLQVTIKRRRRILIIFRKSFIFIYLIKTQVVLFNYSALI